jgi:hypothetical protein
VVAVVEEEITEDKLKKLRATVSEQRAISNKLQIAIDKSSQLAANSSKLRKKWKQEI